MDTADVDHDFMNRRSIKGYDQLAAFYRPIERCVFGDHLQRARTALLNRLPDWDRILILGDGDGRLLHAIVDSVEETQTQSAPRTIVSLDQSPKMLDRQRRRLAWNHPNVSIEFIQADALQYRPPAESLDVIVTPFFLDCFTKEELRSAMPAWLLGLRNQCVWYHVDFVMPDQGWRRVRASILSRVMHLFFGITTGLRNRQLVKLDELFVELGLRPIEQVRSNDNMIETSIFSQTGLQTTLKQSDADEPDRKSDHGQ